MLPGDPVALYGQLHWLDALRRVRTSAAEHFGSDALIEFFGGLVLSLPRTDAIDRIGKSAPIDDLVMRIDTALRMFGQLENMVHFAKIIQEGGEDHLQRKQHMLQLEH